MISNPFTRHVARKTALPKAKEMSLVPPALTTSTNTSAAASVSSGNAVINPPLHLAAACEFWKCVVTCFSSTAALVETTCFLLDHVVVTHDYIASLAFLACWSGLNLGLQWHHFYPIDESFPNWHRPCFRALHLTGRVDGLLEVGIMHEQIMPCLVMHPHSRDLYLRYMIRPFLGKKMAVRDINPPEWQAVLKFIIHEVDHALVPILALVEYLSLPAELFNAASHRENDSIEEGQVAKIVPSELVVTEIRSRHPEITPLLPRLIQYHEHLKQVLISSASDGGTKNDG